MNIDNSIIDDNQKITESFNDFFCQVGTNLANKFSNNDNDQFRNYLNDPANQSLFLYKIKQCEIKNAISKLKNSNSSGHDEIRIEFVKLSAPILIPSLEKNFNLSITTGIYPSQLKIAKVIPIFKKGDPKSLNNYRPISILSTINKKI